MTATASEVRERLPGLARRTVSGTILAVLVLGSIATVPTFLVMVLLITLGSLYELAGLTARKGQALVLPVAAVAVACYLVMAALGVQHQYQAPLLAGTMVASLGVALLGGRHEYLARTAFTIFAVLYIGWLGSYFIALRNLPSVGVAYTVACIVLISSTDIFAMLIGGSIGRTPLTSISPRKTWEGAIGGLSVTVLAGASLALVPHSGFSWTDGALIGAVTSIAAQVGDLVESALKRDAAVKDAGTILGGHGGILDRFDSYTLGGIAFYGALYLTHHIPAIR
ncbi:MAG: phosphatidate cytidylyltransferase [Candidatus Eremiobacteraeota bacterium]|nr:phosphatidate cytidylyltransferase [Candidatus Eremiobacteraeota bacterium]